MLEKDKNCIEFLMHSMMATHKPYQEDTEIAITGMAPGKSLLLSNNPFDIPCDVVVVPKKEFEKLQANANINAELAKQWEINYDLLLKKIGFDTVEELVNYLDSEAECGTLRDAIANLEHNVKFARDERRNLSKKLDECEKDYISERDKAEALETENEQLRNERTHIVYLNDPLGVIAKWEKVTGYDRPEDFLKWKANIEEIMQAWKDRTGCKYPGEAGELLEKWKIMTKCETPEAAATWITSYESACGRGNRLAEMVEKLKEEVVSWKNVTGYSTPEDYMSARLNSTMHFDHTMWQKATGCDTPDQVKSRIEGLENAIRLTNKNMISELDSEFDEWQKFTGCDSPQNAGCKINNLCDEICKLKGDYDYLLGLTGYKSALDVRIAIDDKEYKYRTMRDLVNSLKRKANFTESNWKAATGCNTPGEAETTMRNLKGRIDEIKEFAAIASNWTDRIVED